MTPLETCRAKMQKIYGQMSDLAVRGCSDPIEAKEKSAELLDKLAPLLLEQNRLMDFSGTLGAMHAEEYGGGGRAGGDHVRLRAFRGPNAIEAARRAGTWAAWRLLGSESAAAFCADHGLRASMSEAINTAGGFLVPDEMSTAIVVNREVYGAARRLADVRTMSRESQTIPVRTAGLTAAFVGESNEIPESGTEWGSILLSPKKLAVLTRISSELDDDSIISMAENLADEAAWSFSKKEDDCFILGDGTSTYGGMQGLSSKFEDGTAWKGKITAAANHDTLAEIDSTDITDLMAACPEYALPGASFLCSGSAWGAIFCRLMGAAGGNTFIDISKPMPKSYLGYPIITCPSMPADPAADYSGKVMILFGDFRRAVKFGSRREITMQADRSRYLEFDQIGVRATERFDLVVNDIGTTAAAGPVVALVGH